MAVTEPIAIIGMSGRFPGAASIDELWENLAAGRDCIGELDDEELLRYREDPELIARSDYVRKRPTLSDSDSFDAELFGMTPREAEVRDPQYRIMLETVHGTLEHAGYDPSTYPGQIGLFAGTNVNRYRYDYIERRRDVVNSVGFLAIDVANHPDYLSTYISYKLGLRGPSATVLTACSTSLFAVHLASNAIRAGDCEMAVAGGVDLEFPYHRGYVPLPGGIAAKDGFPRAFDANATGTNFGDGVGAVLLKRLSAAQRDGDTIYAVIRASSVNNDGNRKVGYTAPSVSGQSECIQHALTQAGVSPRDIDYLEAHGTATRVGDPIELTGLIDAYRAVSTEPLPAQYCAIASVKSNIGHLGQAAGIAALIKATLALNHRQIPPSINMSTPTPGVDWASSPFYVNTELRDWQQTAGRPRLAGVSSFGIGGTNAHLILAEPPQTPIAPAPAADQILLWSAVTETAAEALRERLADHFDAADPARFADAAHTLRVGRTARPIRGAVLASDTADAALALRTPDRLIRADGVSRSIAFAFPGQGGLHPGAAQELYDNEPVFREGCDAAFEILRPLLDLDLRQTWQAVTDPAELADTGIAQPLLFTLEYALAHSLMHWGVEPDLLFGHSLGELAAAAVAGVFDFESGLRAVAARAKAMAAMPPGRMLAVPTDPADINDLLGSDIALAAVNGPNQTVLSGPADAITEVAKILAQRQIASKELATSHAFHSPAMAGAIDDFATTLAKLTLHVPDIPLVSSATGTRVTDEQATSVEFWTRQLIEPVRFDRAKRTVFGLGAVTVLEVGPGRTLAALLRPEARAAESRVLTCAPNEKSQGLPEALAQLWVDGAPIRYWQDHDSTGRARIAVPGYPYQRRRYWLDLTQPQPQTKTPAPQPITPESPQQPREESPTPTKSWEFAQLTWTPDNTTSTSHNTLTSGAGTAVLLAPADPITGRLAQSALQRAGFRTVKLTDARDNPAAANAIDPTSVDDWLIALDKQAQAGYGALLVGHAALLAPGTGPADQRLAEVLATLHAALRAAVQAHRRHHLPTRVVLFGTGLVDVTGAEPIDPAAAAAVALVRTAEQENPGLHCQIIDLVGASEDLLSATIADPARPLTALRGRQRWLPGLTSIAPGTDPGGLLRPRGTYLITGGLGGVGIVIARALAETGLGPRLALLGRTGIDGLSEPDRTRAQSEIDALIDAGADVEVRSCDVADPIALAAAVDAVQTRFGPVNGVIHSAGIAGGGLLERRTAEQIAAVLRPKVSGVCSIEDVFADRAPLDFLMLFSSQAGLSGLYGSADYAAANAFLDAHARRGAGTTRRTISVQWPGWSEVGMLARSPEAHTVLATPPAAAGIPESAAEPDLDEAAFRTTRTPNADWEFDEHVFEGVPVLPGTALLEFAVQAAHAAGLPGAGRALELRGTAFLAPVVGDAPRQVRVLLNPMADVHRFRVQARPAGSNEPWTDHATGTVGSTDIVAAPHLPDLQERLPSKTKSGLAGWIKFGPRWATITTTSGSDHERLARLILPEQYHADFADHPVHPALLDVAAGVLTDLTAGKAYAPFLYRRILVQDKLTADLTVHARFTEGGRHPRPVDFDIYDTPTGRLLLRAEAFTMRAVATQSGFSPAAQPKPADPKPSTGLLSPTDGGQAFLELLDPDMPPVVLVDLPTNRLAVAGIPRLDALRQPELPPPPPTPLVPAPVAPAPATPRPNGDDVLNRLRTLWSDALGVTDIKTDADFFDLGGNSLAAVQLAARISAAFGIELSAGTLFDAGTIDTLAEEVRALTT